MSQPYAILWWYGFSIYDSTYRSQQWWSIEVESLELLQMIIDSGIDNRLTCPLWFDTPVPWFVEYL